MKMKKTNKSLLSIFLISSILFIISCKNSNVYTENDTIKTDSGNIIITPIKHATFVIETNNKTIFVDPVGEKTQYKKFKKPDIILLTDIHGDHLNVKLVNELKSKKTIIVGTKAVAKQLLKTRILKNKEEKTFAGIKILAMPMYNMTENRKKFHGKGRGNGYVLLVNNKKIYISGDTEDIPEMRSLKNIDIAFLCMNLPYTMTEEQAASAVLDFKPKIVYPYHYRGKKDDKVVFSDINKFKKLVSKDKNIEVRFLKWY
jgi:L-ascorbate metabolism protein UlaG (beta-lactamase superfamily)